MVQYGSSESAKRTWRFQRAKEKERLAERVRRARLINDAGGGTWCSSGKWPCFPQS